MSALTIGSESWKLKEIMGIRRRAPFMDPKRLNQPGNMARNNETQLLESRFTKEHKQTPADEASIWSMLASFSAALRWPGLARKPQTVKSPPLL